MHEYLVWDEQTITDFSEEQIRAMYDRGFVFTRKGKGVMQQTRSVRIDLSQFELTSENKRVLRKTESLALQSEELPTENYHWIIGKKAKHFYDIKFGEGTFSANKVKELLTEDHNFNVLFGYYDLPEATDRTHYEGEELASMPNPTSGAFSLEDAVGHAICVEAKDMLHYSYPFYDLEADKNTGMSMMIRAVLWAKEFGLGDSGYVYLGSFQRPGDIYKLQFKGMEWFDGKEWQNNLEALKELV